MKDLQALTDKTAISLSLLCTVHCLALPFVFIIFPSIAALQLDNEAFHFWMIVAVLPTSIYALTMGCKEHKHTHLLALGALGLTSLLLAVLLSETLLGEFGEKLLTVFGAAIIAYGHYQNYRLCQHSESCACPKHHEAQGISDTN